MIENVSTQLTVFHCFAHCLLPGRAFASLYVLLFLEKEAEIGGRVRQSLEFHKIGFKKKNVTKQYVYMKFVYPIRHISPKQRRIKVDAT